MDNRQQLLDECHSAFRETESARILALYRSRDNRLSFDERLSITKEIEKVFYPVFLELRNVNPSLTDWDLMLSVLSYEGFSVSVIAECFSVSNDAVRMRKSRLREKLPQEWFSLIFHGVTKMYQEQCHDCVTQNISGAGDAAIPLASETQNETVMEQNSWIIIAALLAISHSAASVRRIQDTDRNGWLWVSTYLVPWIVFIVMFIWRIEYDVHLRNFENGKLPDTFVMNWANVMYAIDLIILVVTFTVTIVWYSQKGTEGPNIYGPDPLYRYNSKPINN